MYKKLIQINNDGSFTYSSSEGIINSKTVCTPHGVVDIQEITGWYTGRKKTIEDTGSRRDMLTGEFHMNRNVYENGTLQYTSRVTVDKEGNEKESNIQLNLYRYK